MSTRLAPALNINTDFVSQKDDSLKDIYTDTDSVAYKAADAVGADERGIELLDKKFSDMTATEITDFVNAQIEEITDPLREEVTLSDGETAPEGFDTITDSNDDVTGYYLPYTLSYDAQVLRNDILSWILERRANDLNSAMEKDEEIFDITNATLDLTTTLIDVFKNYSQYKLKTNFSEPRLSAKTDFNLIGEVAGFNPKGELSKKTKDDIEKIILDLELLFTALIESTTDEDRERCLEKFFLKTEEEDGILGGLFDEEKIKNINKAGNYLTKIIISKPVKLSGGGDESVYHCNINCEIKEHNEIFVSYNEYQSPLFTDEIDATTHSLLILARKLLGLVEDSANNLLILFQDFLEFGRDSVIPLARSVQTHVRKNDIRTFARASDLAGNVGTVKEGTLAYVKGGYYIDSGNAIKNITEETST